MVHTRFTIEWFYQLCFYLHFCMPSWPFLEALLWHSDHRLPLPLRRFWHLELRVSKNWKIWNIKKTGSYFYPNGQLLFGDLFRVKHEITLSEFMRFNSKSTYSIDKRENFSKNKIFLDLANGALMWTYYSHKKIIFSNYLELEYLIFVFSQLQNVCVLRVCNSTTREKKDNWSTFFFFLVERTSRSRSRSRRR